MNKMTSQHTAITSLILRVLTCRVSFGRLAASLLLLAILMPIAAPIPVWAYDLNIAPVPINESSPKSASVNLLRSLTNGGTNFRTGMATLFHTLLFNGIDDKGTDTESRNAETLASLSKRVVRIETSVQQTSELEVGNSIELSALPLDENGHIVHGIQPEWAAENAAVLRVFDRNRAVGIAPGETTLHVSAGRASLDLVVKVVKKQEASVDKTNDSAATEGKPGSRPQPMMLVDDIEEGGSTYTPENNVGSPPNQSEMDAPNLVATTRIKHRAGVANYSFDVPFAALPGRGIDASIGMTYNGRIWNKSGVSPNAQFTYNVDRNWLAPGFTVGYGKLKSYFLSRTVTVNNQAKTYNEVIPEGYTDADGTRHQLACKVAAFIPGSTTNSYCTEYGTTDGTFVRVFYNGARTLSPYLTEDRSIYASTFFTLQYSDATKVQYSLPIGPFGPQDDFYKYHYPTLIQDRNGNQINIAYQNGKETIDYIRDTMGRYIRFYYDPTAEKKLVAVTAPGFNGQADRQTIRFYYDENVPLAYQNRFSGNVVAPTTIRALRYVYFPATGTGYRYDYHPNFGMITKIAKLTGMTVTGGDSLTSTGTVNSGSTEASSTTYLYPNDGSQTPLTDVPKYTQRTDDWLGRTPSGSPAPITHYDAPEPATGADQITKVTVSEDGYDVEYKTVEYNTADWMNGLTKSTSVNQITGLTSTPVSTTTYSWTLNAQNGLPLLTNVKTTDDGGNTKAVSFEYDGWGNRTVVREHDFAAPTSLGTELRRTETTYETNQSWINNNLIHLPKEVKTFVGSTPVSKVVYEYDDYGTAGLANTPGVIQHNPDYNPNSGTHQCNPHYVCDPGDFPPHCPLEYDECPNWDPSTNFRGNITKVTAFSDATLTSDNNASVKTMEYDMTGNVIEASMSCCNVKTIEYAAVNQYAYPTKETRGSSPQLINMAAYDFNTGLINNTTDENNQLTSVTYDPVSLRQTRVDFPDGAWSTASFNDTQFPYSVQTTSSLDANRSVSSWSFLDGAEQEFRSRSLTATGYLSSDIEFDNMGRPVKSFNPYTVAGLSDARPTGIKFTEVTSFDALGRTLATKLADDTIVQAAYSGTTATMTDQAGKKRRQIADALGRIIRVDEPDASGNLGAVGSPVQPTYYEYDGNNNLAKVTQTAGSVTQQRAFVYDALSRLRRERQVESSPTLDIAGVKGTPASNKWTGVYEYNADGLLAYGIDARGVKTTFAYDGLNRVQTVTYTAETGYQTPQVTYTYDEARNDPNNNPYLNRGRLTTVATAAITTGQSTPATIQKYDYDSVGQVVNHNQTIDQQTYNLQYGYNLAGQITSEKYPSGKVINMTVDNFGLTQTIADSQRTYLSGVTSNFSPTGMTSQMNFGNGTSETYVFNERFQMTGQSLMKGTEVLQKYDYAYGLTDTATGTVDATKNNGQLGKIEGWIGANKQWSQRFGYDELGRLSEAREYKQGDNAQLTYKQKFDFDRFGNLYRKAASNPTSGQQNPLLYTPIEDSDIDKSTNRLTTQTTYDDAGNVINDMKFRNMGFGYDANGRMVKATKTNQPDANTVYDALGNRVATKINDVWQYMIYDAFGQLVAEYGVQSGSLGGVKYIQQDHQGSVRTLTNSNGFVVTRTDYQAFGEEIGSGIGLRSSTQGYTPNKVSRQGYALTENDDATGLNHTWFRKNEARAGRWTSPDPSSGSMSLDDPQSFSRYSYVGNDPANYVDPSGLEAVICDASMSWGVCYALNGWYGGGFWGGHLGQGEGVAGTWTISEWRQFDRDWWNYYQFVSFTPAFGGFNGDSRSQQGGDCPKDQNGRYLAVCTVSPPQNPGCGGNKLLVPLAPNVRARWGGNARPLFSPPFASRFNVALRNLNNRGITPLITSAFRTAADQERMRRGGSGRNPAARGISMHQTGNAVDISGTQTPQFATIRRVMQAQGFSWGHSYNDNPHFDLNPYGRGTAGYEGRKQNAAAAAENYYRNCR